MYAKSNSKRNNSVECIKVHGIFLLVDNLFPEREYSFDLFSVVGFGYLGYAGNKSQAIFSSNLNELVNKLHPV